MGDKGGLQPATNAAKSAVESSSNSSNHQPLSPSQENPSRSTSDASQIILKSSPRIQIGSSYSETSSKRWECAKWFKKYGQQVRHFRLEDFCDTQKRQHIEEQLYRDHCQRRSQRIDRLKRLSAKLEFRARLANLNGSRNSPVGRICDVPLTEDDIISILPIHAMTDNAIDAWVEIMNQELGSKSIISSSNAQMIRSLEDERESFVAQIEGTAYLPFQARNHWSLLIIDVENETISHLDSENLNFFGSQSAYHVQLASDFAEKFPGMSFRVVDCIKQEAASLDCGPMMLNNILRHIRKIDPMQKFDAGGFRAKMMKMIENGIVPRDCKVSKKRELSNDESETSVGVGKRVRKQ